MCIIRYSKTYALPEILVLALCCLTCKLSLAEATKDILDLSPEELVNLDVVSVSRFKQKSSEAPSSVETITADDIRSFGWRTLADALTAIRGMYIRNDRDYQQVGVRGVLPGNDFNSRVLIMINGRRINDAMFDSTFLGEDFIIDMNIIDRIEYMPGSGSAVYGANAIMGVINVITKSGKDVNSTRLSGEVGSMDTYRGRATLGKQWKNGVDLLINASQFYSHGNEYLYYPEFATTNNGIAQDMDLERSRRLFGQLSYQNFTLRSGYISRFKRNPTGTYGTIFNDKGTFTDDTQAYVDLDYNTALTPNVGLQVRGFYHMFNHENQFPILAFKGTPLESRMVNLDNGNGRWWGGEAKLTGILFERHKWTAGVELQYDQRQKLEQYFINPYYLNNRSNNGGWRTGLYAQDEYRITDSLLLNVGLRLDQHHMIKSLQLNPRVGLIWDITPNLTTKLIYSSAFRAPNIFERDVNTPLLGFLANPNNTEEHVKSYESVVEWRPGHGYRLMGSLFYNHFTNLLIHPDSTPPPYQFINTGKLTNYGIELEGEKRWANGRLLKLSWTHAELSNENPSGITFTDSPKNLVKLHYAEPLFKDTIRFGLENIFVDSRHTLANHIASSYHLLNINLALTKPIYGFNASLGIYNVLNQHYPMLMGREHAQDTLAMDGRTARFRLEYSF